MIIDTYESKELHRAIGIELFRERQKRGVSLFHTACSAHLDRKIVERIELGKPVPRDIIQKLLNRYHKKLKIELVD